MTQRYGPLLLASGVQRSLGYCAGLVVGATVVLLAVASGVTAFLLAVPSLRCILVVAAMGYTLWLAYRLATARLKVTLLAVMVVLIHGTWLLAGKLLMPALRSTGRARAVNIALAGLLVVATVLALPP